MKCVWHLMLVLVSFQAFADAKYPASCKPIAVRGEKLILSTHQPVVIFIHNISADAIWLTHPVATPSASAGWSSQLQDRHWSALVLNQKSFELACIESKPGHEQQIPCAGVIELCKWSKVKMPKASMGTYWAGEDQSLSELTVYLRARGFKPLNK